MSFLIPTSISDVTGIYADKSTVTPVPKLAGKVVVITGVSGIALATVSGLVKAGAKVYIAARNEGKVDQAIKDLRAANNGIQDGQINFLKIDLSSLASARDAAAEFQKQEKRLDIVICNAGVMAVPFALTGDGIEQQFQVNHLSHFAFVTALLPLMEKSGTVQHPSRVINLSSFAHNFISLSPFTPRFDSLESVNRYFEPMGYIRYSQAKLCAILFSRELNRRCKAVRSIAIHPGFVRSGLYDHQMMLKWLTFTFISTEEGAISSLYAATSPEVEEKDLWGSYMVPFAKVKPTTAYGNDAQLAKDLWNLSEALVLQKTGTQ